MKFSDDRVIEEIWEHGSLIEKRTKDERMNQEIGDELLKGTLSYHYTLIFFYD